MNATQCRMARAALQLGVRELAALARVSTTTVTKLERGEPLMPRTAEAIQRALEAKGIEFTHAPPGVALRGHNEIGPKAEAPKLGLPARSNRGRVVFRLPLVQSSACLCAKLSSGTQNRARR
jgi:transcriptional regulator with XRE-family HTH domain